MEPRACLREPGNVINRSEPRDSVPVEVIMSHKDLVATSLLVLLLLGGAVVLGMPEQSWPDAAALQTMTARFAPVDIGADVSALPAGERRALAKLVEAGRIMDALFLRQVWAGNEAVLARPAGRPDAARPGAPARVPRQQGPVVAARPQRAVHPRRARRSPRARTSIRPARRRPTSRRGSQTLPEADRARATGFFTTIRRGAGRRASRIVPYSVEYQGELARAAELLREAARPHAPTRR